MDNPNNQKTTEPNKPDNLSNPRFRLGQLYATPGAQAALERCQTNPFDLAKRHTSGDWGTVCPEDAQANEDALKTGARLLSTYLLQPPLGTEDGSPIKIWLITEADRSVTTILLPSEY